MSAKPKRTVRRLDWGTVEWLWPDRDIARKLGVPMALVRRRRKYNDKHQHNGTQQTD